MSLSKLGLKARAVVLVGVVALALGGVQAVQALVASPKLATSRADRLAQIRRQVAAHAGPQAPVTRGASTRAAGSGATAKAAAAATVACGGQITASVTLQADLACTNGNGLTITAPNVVLNLNGHVVASVQGGGTGIQVFGTKATVENGDVLGFGTGIVVTSVEGSPQVDQVKLTKLTVGYSQGIGIANNSSRLQVTNVASAYNTSGMQDFGTLSVIKTSRFLSNSFLGYGGTPAQLVGNVANGNGAPGGDSGYGFLIETPNNAYSNATLTGNTASNNNGFGISSVLPVVDGGKNLAKGNRRAEQCEGVVCG